MPIRSESEAFRLVAGSALAVGISVLVGWLTEPLVGVVIFAVAFLVAAITYLRAPNPDRRLALRDAARAPHGRGAPPGERHVLVIANETLSGAELRERILGGDGERLEVDVLAPVLTARVHSGVSDIDREVEQARARLERSLAWAREQGFVARGAVGDPSPITAIEDELRRSGADEVIVVTHSRENETWQEHAEVERLRRELDIPVTHVVVEDASAQANSGASRPPETPRGAE